MTTYQSEEQTEKIPDQSRMPVGVYESIITALSDDYFNLYYVDVETDAYIEYGSRTEKGQKGKEKRGTDFFTETRKNAERFIYKEDLESFTTAMEKTRLLAKIRKHGTFIFHYRLVIGDRPNYVGMKATRIAGDDRHIIIGISDVDSQVRDRIAAQQAVKDNKSYQRLTALINNLLVLYFIDPENNRYTEYSASKKYRELGIAKQGEDFFRSTYENSFRTIHPEDQALFHAQVTKENILAAIGQDGMFVLDYRLMRGDLPTYVRLKATMIEEEGKAMLIIGLLDEDVQIRQEQEYARRLSVARTLATVDSLTGVKNKHAYVQWEEKINTKIDAGEQEAFAVVVLDINSLKAVNDLYGHKEGDACIKKACATICGIFSHSPVFRVGGDEFVALLSGEDYERRRDLMEQINDMPKDRSKIRIGETIAAGIAEYRADRHRYVKKQFMKQFCASEAPEAERDPEPEDVPMIRERKQLLIADDVESNREILGDLLEDDYDLFFASDGIEALDMLQSHKDEIALVLLDLYMPHMSGREVIAKMQVDDDLMSIPVIFLTIDQNAELDCLRIGAMDFIPKPFPDIDIVKARIAKCIELFENRDLIRHTERDKLTGLLNKDYFYRYVSRLDHIYKGAALDAIVCDVNRFRSVNKQFGRQEGDRVLRSIGLSIRKLTRKTGGIGCRQGGDTFLLYCPHQDDYEELLRELLFDAFGEQETDRKVRLRFGVFPSAEQEPDIEERFVCAKIASERVKDDPDRICGYYDLNQG